MIVVTTKIERNSFLQLGYFKSIIFGYGFHQIILSFVQVVNVTL